MLSSTRYLSISLFCVWDQPKVICPQPEMGHRKSTLYHSAINERKPTFNAKAHWLHPKKYCTTYPARELFSSRFFGDGAGGCSKTLCFTNVVLPWFSSNIPSTRPWLGPGFDSMSRNGFIHLFGIIKWLDFIQKWDFHLEKWDIYYEKAHIFDIWQEIEALNSPKY